jgi:flagellar biosynthesis GTPase FlhF
MTSGMKGYALMDINRILKGMMVLMLGFGLSTALVGCGDRDDAPDSAYNDLPSLEEARNHVDDAAHDARDAAEQAAREAREAAERAAAEARQAAEEAAEAARQTADDVADEAQERADDAAESIRDMAP